MVMPAASATPYSYRCAPLAYELLCRLGMKCYGSKCRRKTVYSRVKVVLNRRQWLEERGLWAQPRKGASNRVAW